MRTWRYNPHLLFLISNIFHKWKRKFLSFYGIFQL
jgi:hypothetical protein